MNPDLQPRLADFRKKLGTEANPDFNRALAEAVVERARTYIKGIRAYHRHPARRILPEAPIVWKSGTTVVRAYGSAGPEAPALLAVPSLINRLDILDLDKDHSFLRALAERGHRVYAVDWSEPGEEEENFSLQNYVEKRLEPVLAFLEADKQPLHLLGYCMGGCLALALAARQPQSIRSLLLLATPWDFHRPDPTIGQHFHTLADQMEPYMQSLGILPVDIIQSLFVNFQPVQSINKFTEFATLDPASVEARHFVLCEDWLNDGVPLAAPAARNCLKEWYGDNLPGRLLWHCGKTLVDPRKLTIPSYIVVPGKDRIVPPESALPLARLLQKASLHEPMTGHIGMIASTRAPHQVWQPLMGWLENH